LSDNVETDIKTLARDRKGRGGWKTILATLKTSGDPSFESLRAQNWGRHSGKKKEKGPPKL